MRNPFLGGPFTNRKRIQMQLYAILGPGIAGRLKRGKEKVNGKGGGEQ